LLKGDAVPYNWLDALGVAYKANKASTLPSALKRSAG
jgi:hypothetical protein